MIQMFDLSYSSTAHWWSPAGMPSFARVILHTDIRFCMALSELVYKAKICPVETSRYCNSSETSLILAFIKSTPSSRGYGSQETRGSGSGHWVPFPDAY